MILLRPIGGGCEQAPRRHCRSSCFVLRCTRGRAWRLVTRGAPPLDGLFTRLVWLRPFGRGCEQARRKRGSWYWVGGDVLLSVLGYSSCVVIGIWIGCLSVCLSGVPSVVGVNKRRVNDVDGIGLTLM